MVYLDQNAFMTELSKLYARNKATGTVWLTMKRVERPIVTGRKKLDTEGPVCLFRATNGKRKIATWVPQGEHINFHMELFTVIKANTDALKRPKRNRKTGTTTTV